MTFRTPGGPPQAEGEARRSQSQLCFVHGVCPILAHHHASNDVVRFPVNRAKGTRRRTSRGRHFVPVSRQPRTSDGGKHVLFARRERGLPLVEVSSAQITARLCAHR